MASSSSASGGAPQPAGLPVTYRPTGGDPQAAGEDAPHQCLPLHEARTEAELAAAIWDVYDLRKKEAWAAWEGGNPKFFLWRFDLGLCLSGSLVDRPARPTAFP